MRRMSTSELRELEVINLCGGERLGYPCEFELDLDNCSVISIIVSNGNGIFPLFSERDEYIIPWCKIECIGEDAILVKITQAELCMLEKGKRKKKKCK